jgi:hypothetical protein
MDAPFIAWSHASVSAVVFRGLQTQMMPGLSTQTMLGMTLCSMLTVAKKFYWPIYDLMHGTKPEDFADAKWYTETSAWIADSMLLLGCVFLLCHRQRGGKSEVDDKEVEDDFGRSQTRFVWYSVSDRLGPPPTYLHWAVIYLVTALLAFLAILMQVKFSFAALRAVASRDPTTCFAVVINFMRGVALLPQLHLSRRIGYVAPGAAVWIAMKGAVDLVELVADGISFTEICYFLGDITTFLLVSDYLWLFVKSRARGRVVVEIPDALDV